VTLGENTEKLLFHTDADAGERKLRWLEGDALAKRTRRLLDDAFVGVIRPYWQFHPSDISQPKRLAMAIDKPANAAQTFVRDQLSEDARTVAANPVVSDEELRRILATELHRLAAGPAIYTDQRFAEVITGHETVKQAEQTNTGEALYNVNAGLLEEMFVHHIHKARNVSVHLPWQMIFYLSAGLALGIVVSLITKPADPVKLERYYALIRTPIVAGEKVEQPCTLPKNAVTNPPRKLLPFKSIELYVPSIQMLAGFIAGWLAAAVLIGFFFWIIS
jgi:hypothetical protein